jgi:hypothetical protein
MQDMQTQDPYKRPLGGDVRLQYDLSKRYSINNDYRLHQPICKQI